MTNADTSALITTRPMKSVLPALPCGGPRLHAALLLFGLATLACSSDETTDLGTGSYAIATTIFQADGRTSLVALVDDPTSEAELDTSRALEVGGAAALFGRDGRNVFALGTSDAPVLTRYELDDDGALVERGQMSLQGHGIDSGFLRPDLVPFLSDTKAYWIDDAGLQVLVWNPERMELIGSFSLDDAARADALLELGEAVVRDDTVFVSASYRDADELDQGQAVVLVIDAVADTLETVLTDDRCGSTKEIAPAEDGTLFIASEALAASQYALDRPPGYPAPCILRILPGERRFDPDFTLSIPDLVDGRSAGRLVTAPDSTAYVLALHEELLSEPLSPDTDLYTPWDSPAWRWWRIDLGAARPAELVEDAPISGAASRVLHAGGQDFISALDLESGTTTLLVPTETTLRRGLTLTGYPYGLVKVR